MAIHIDEKLWKVFHHGEPCTFHKYNDIISLVKNVDSSDHRTSLPLYFITVNVCVESALLVWLYYLSDNIPAIYKMLVPQKRPKRWTCIVGNAYTPGLSQAKRCVRKISQTSPPSFLSHDVIVLLWFGSLITVDIVVLFAISWFM